MGRAVITEGSRIKRMVLVTGCIMLLWSAGCTRVIEREIIKEVPSAPASSAGTILFDDFGADMTHRNLWKSNGKAHWVWQGKTAATPGCEDGCLKQNSEDARALNAIQYVTTPQISNATIETKARINFDLSIAEEKERLKALKYFVGTGIVFRMVDENNFYMFRLAGEEGCVLGKMVDGRWVDLKNPRRLNFLEGGRIKPNVWYTLKVKAYGDNIQCFINDSPVINMSDSDPKLAVGHFGLVTFKCFGDFEYIKVTE